MKKAWMTLVMLIAVVSLWATAAMPTASADTLPSGKQAEEIGAALDAFLAAHADNHAAVATAVFAGNEDICTRYFGTINTEGNPLDADCVFEWGSTTKLLVWVSAMQLVMAGKLDLQADIRTYLPDGFLRNLRYDAPITMLNLMNHNAGFQEANEMLEVANADDILPLGTYLARYQPLQVFAPSEVVAYSNWGAALAGYIVECVAEQPFAQYVQTHIFAPLGMTHSAVASDLSDNGWVQERRQAFLSYLPDGTLAKDTKVYILPYPAGACTSTLDDFATFGKALLTRDARLLSQEGFDLMYAPSLLYTGTQNTRLAHGFLVDYEFGATIVGHDGNTAGGSSRLLLDLQHNVGMVMLTNQLGGSLYRNAMAELVFGESTQHVEVDGYYVPARGVLAGKEKFYSGFMLIDACHITTAMADGLYLNVCADRLEISATDYLAADVTRYRARDAVTIIWFVLLGYAALNMLVRFGIAIADAVKKKALDILNLWSGLYSLLLVLSVVGLLPAIPAEAVLVFIILLSLASVATIVYLACIAKRATADKAHKASYLQTWSLLLTFALTLANVVIWDLARIL